MPGQESAHTGSRTVRDFRLPQRCSWEPRSSGLLRGDFFRHLNPWHGTDTLWQTATLQLPSQWRGPQSNHANPSVLPRFWTRVQLTRRHLHPPTYTCVCQQLFLSRRRNVYKSRESPYPQRVLHVPSTALSLSGCRLDRLIAKCNWQDNVRATRLRLFQRIFCLLCYQPEISGFGREI